MVLFSTARINLRQGTGRVGGGKNSSRPTTGVTCIFKGRRGPGSPFFPPVPFVPPDSPPCHRRLSTRGAKLCCPYLHPLLSSPHRSSVFRSFPAAVCIRSLVCL